MRATGRVAASSVDFDGRQVIVRAKNPRTGDALGGSTLVLDVNTIRAAALHPAGFLSDGHLEILTDDGRRVRLQFLRMHQSTFKALHSQLLSVRPTAATPSPDPAQSTKSSTNPQETLLARGYYNQEVVGESHYFNALRKLAGQSRTGERELLAVLRREPGNRHDRNAVQVSIDGHVVGYLPREDAGDYRLPLRMIESQGKIARCGARQWWSRERDTFIASVSLDLAEPACLVAVNSLDTATPHLLIPAGRTVQVTRENEHMDALVPLIERVYLPGKVRFYGELRRVERAGPRSSRQIVTVHIDGHEIGELSKQSSTKYLSILLPMEAAGIACRVHVVLTGNTLAVEAKLLITPPEEFTSEFLASYQKAIA